MSFPQTTRLLIVSTLLFFTNLGCEEEIDINDDEEPTPITSLLDLGDDCLVAAYIAISDGRAYVTCEGTWGADEGRLVVITLEDLSILASTHLGGMAGPVVVNDQHVVIADGLEGRVFMTDLDGEPLHDSTDPVVLCPSDPDAGSYQFIRGLSTTGDGELLASCFGSSEIIRFEYSPGTDTGEAVHARVTGRTSAGHGPGTSAAWSQNRAVVIDELAGTATLLELGAEMAADVGRWMLGEAPVRLAIENEHMYVTNSLSHTLQLLDLERDPESATVQEVFIGDGTNPMDLAIRPDGSVLVTLLMTNQLAIVDLVAGAVTAKMNLPAGDDLLPLEGMNPLARPHSVVLTETGRALVTLNNLDENWQPAGRGLLAVLDLDEESR